MNYLRIMLLEEFYYEACVELAHPFIGIFFNRFSYYACHLGLSFIWVICKRRGKRDYIHQMKINFNDDGLFFCWICFVASLC